MNSMDHAEVNRILFNSSGHCILSGNVVSAQTSQVQLRPPLAFGNTIRKSALSEAEAG